MVTQSKKRAGTACALLTASAIAMPVMGGNQGLMEQARIKAFLFNEQVVSQLSGLDGTAAVSLNARVKQLPDGSFRVLVDGLNVHGPIEAGSFPFGHTGKNNYIEYVIFEDMSGTAPAQELKAKPE